MRLAGLFSGGKDSTYAAHLAENAGHKVVKLLSVYPARMDSWMFHSVNIRLAPMIANAIGTEFLSTETHGEKEKELESLREILNNLPVDGVVSGAIMSTYQRARIDAMASELGLTHIAPLWGQYPEQVLRSEIESGMHVVMTAVAAQGLTKSWLGRKIDESAFDELVGLSGRYGINVCGEGGEYETIVLDAPWFLKRLRINEAAVIWDGTSGYYNVTDVELQDK
jgi:ABC transporter with metal-binding/Fe-S-binding domain ATP-binding protein